MNACAAGIIDSAVASLADTLEPVGKRVFDVILTLFVAPLALPITALAALVLAVELRGNPLFLQKRIGRGGRPFTMYKLRTMRAARPGEEPRRVVTDWSAYVFSPPGYRDPRITRFGAFARRTSIDELPNLLNVLLGQMSIVGPRPEIPDLVAQYPPEWHRRHHVRPGIAGLAQANGRSDLTYAESASYDLAYVDDHSLMKDAAILARTALAVFGRQGAR